MCAKIQLQELLTTALLVIATQKNPRLQIAYCFTIRYYFDKAAMHS